MNIGSILDVPLGSEYTSEILFHLNVWSLSSHLKIYKNTLLNLTLKVEVLKGSMTKDKKYFQYARQTLCNCNGIFQCQMLSKTHLESTLQNNKTCTPRYSYGEYSQLLIYWIQPILFKNNCNYWAEETY